MTISTEVNDVTHDGDGLQTSWPFQFNIPDDDSYEVLITAPNGAITTADPSTHSITGLNNEQGGFVTYPLTGPALASGYKLTINRKLTYTQPTKLRQQRRYDPQVVEETMDRLEMQIQQVNAKADRSVQVPISSDTSPENYLSDIEVLAAQAAASAAAAGVSETGAESARDAILNDAGFQIVAADLLGPDTIGVVAASMTNVNTVAGAIANVNTVAGAVANVNTVAGAIANVNTVAGSITAVNTAAANIAAIVAAPTEASNAAASAALAQSWAVGLIGARPEGSAQYWAQQAQSIVGGSLAGLSVVGRSANTTGATAAITAATDGHVLRRSGTTLGFGTIGASSLSFTPAVLNVAQTFSGAQRNSVTALTSSAASIATNLALNNDFTHTTTENTTLANPTNITVGQKGRIAFTQGATPRTLAYGSYWKFPGGVVPALTNSAGAIDVLYYDVISSTQIVCNLVKGFA